MRLCLQKCGGSAGWLSVIFFRALTSKSSLSLSFLKVPTELIFSRRFSSCFAGDLGDADENVEQLCWGTSAMAMPGDEKIGLMVGGAGGSRDKDSVANDDDSRTHNSNISKPYNNGTQEDDQDRWRSSSYTPPCTCCSCRNSHAISTNSRTGPGRGSSAGHPTQRKIRNSDPRLGSSPR